jgi:pyruvate/oxaloacetate carboxyltransferase
MFLATAAVHTTGINWTSVLTIVVSILSGIAVLSAGLASVVRSSSRQVATTITAAINQFRIDVVNQLDVRLTAVETKMDDIRDKQNKYTED